MAYESDQSAVTSALTNSNPVVFTDTTISKILALTTTDNSTVRFDTVAPDASGNVTVPAGAEVVLINSSDTTQTTITPPANAPVLIFQGKGGVSVTINDGDSNTSPHSPGVVDRVVVGSAGNDRIVVSDAKNTQIILGTGNSTVVGGSGSDTIIAGLGNSTIAGGAGDIVQLKGNASDYTVTVNNGHAVVTGSNNKVTDISKIQYVQLDSGKALVFAKDSQEAAITTLYETAFGRTAESGGLQYWFDLASAGASLDQISQAFTQSTEFQQTTGALNNDDFVNALYQQTFGRAPESEGLAYWTAALQTGGASRAELGWTLCVSMPSKMTDTLPWYSPGRRLFCHSVGV